MRRRSHDDRHDDPSGPRPEARVPVPVPVPIASPSQSEALRIAEQLEALIARRRSPAPARRAPAAETTGPRHSGRLLGNLLVARGFIVDRELEYALLMQASSGRLLGQVLVELGLISEATLVEALAEQLRMNVVDLTKIEFDYTTGALLAESDARRLCAVAFRRRGDRIDVAVSDPTDGDAARWLSEELCAPVRLLLATRTEIEAALDALYPPRPSPS